MVGNFLKWTHRLGSNKWVRKFKVKDKFANENTADP